jgi:hypothetical protein
VRTPAGAYARGLGPAVHSDLAALATFAVSGQDRGSA